MKRHMQYWGAAYILAALWAFSWLGQAIAMMPTIEEEGWSEFWAATFENWQSEWLQLFVQSVLLLALGHKLFKADKEDMEKVQQDLKDIKQKLEELS